MSLTESHILTTENAPSGTRPRARWILILLLVWIVCAAYEGALLKRGWVPHDDGAFAQNAERVLHGEMPHRDFDELYTGGLTYLNASALRLFGTNFASLRYILFLFFLAWIPAIFYIGTRLVRPWAAAGITALAVVASVPVYSAAVPSWYNLFFATFGTAAILRFLETRARLWLAVTGLCAGLSFLAKISGLYFLAAILLFLIFLEQSSSRTPDRKKRVGAYALFVTSGLLAFVLVLFRTVTSVNPGYVAHFILPGVSIAIYLVWSEFTYSRGADSSRFRKIFGLAIPVVAGFALPVIAFLVPYVVAGSLHSFIVGVFVSPTKRFAFAALHPTHLRAMNLAATAALAAILYRSSKDKPLASWQKQTLALVCLALLIGSAPLRAVYSFIWSSMVLLVPVATVIGVILIAYAREDDAGQQRERLFLLLCVVALSSLIQFPFAAPIYFCYVTPLVLLAATSLITLWPVRNRFALATILVFYLAFWIFRATPGFIFNLGLRYAPNQQTATLTLPRAGVLRVNPKLADEYQRLIPLIQQHANGDYIYAAPDCPEVYFLAEKRNPTRTMFDFFDGSAPNHKDRIFDALDRTGVNVVAISTEPPFSTPMNPALVAALAERYPHEETVGRFQVRWRQ